MFFLGNELYRLTARDEETLLVEPYFRRISSTMTPAQAADAREFVYPLDRCLYIDGFQLTLNPAEEALSVAQSFTIGITTQDGSGIANIFSVHDNAGLIGNHASTRGAGVSVRLQDRPKLVVPPGLKIRLDLLRSVTTNAYSWRCDLNAYLIPPGRIGRGI